MTKRSRTGQAITEAAIAFMAFALILFGTIDFGRSYFRCQALQNAVIEGTAYASKHGGVSTPLMAPANQQALIDYVKNNAWGLDKTNINFTVTPSWCLSDPLTGMPVSPCTTDPTASPGNFVSINASYPMQLTGFIQQYFGGSGCNRAVNCTATSTMRIVGQ